MCKEIFFLQLKDINTEVYVEMTLEATEEPMNKFFSNYKATRLKKSDNPCLECMLQFHFGNFPKQIKN